MYSDVVESEYYDLLGVPTNATPREIKTAFHKKAMQWHPDKNQGDPEAGEKFKEFKEAYDVLSDEQKRRKYDQHGKSYFTEGGSGGGRGGMDASDIFSAFFGGGFRSTGPKRTHDLVHPLEVTLEELYNGTTKQMKITRKKICYTCRGSGTSRPDAVTTCQDCQGSGIKVQTRRMGGMMFQQQRGRCDTCYGTGESIRSRDRCRTCNAHKMVSENKILKVDIDKGMEEDKRVVFRGEANEEPGSVTGDVIFVIKEAKHKQFKREGPHLIIEKDIPLVNALTGMSFNIQHLDGRMIHITVCSGDIIKQDDIREVPEEGMPIYGSPFTKGSLYVKFNIIFPQYLSPKQIESVKKNLPGNATENRPGNEAENVILEEVNVDRMKRRRDRYTSNAYEESSEEEHERGGVSCQHQ